MQRRVFKFILSRSASIRNRSRVQVQVWSGTSRDSVDRASRWYRQGQTEAQAGQRSVGSLHPQAGRAYLCDALPRLISSCRCIALSCRSRACQLAALGSLLARWTTMWRRDSFRYKIIHRFSEDYLAMWNAKL